MKNTLKCNITGTERVTNVPYLTKKADRLGITVEEYKSNYVSKAALGNIKTDIAETSITEINISSNRSLLRIVDLLESNFPPGF